MRRIPELDSLRGLAALAIVLYHFRPLAFYFGWAAVDLFFVLSGFLITSIILRYHGSGGFLAAFYGRRILRIWPIYYLTLLALLAVMPFCSTRAELAGLPYYLTFTQNIQHYWFGDLPAFSLKFGHTWTLAIEEQFYLVWPALVILVGKRRLLPLCGALVGVSALARGLGFDWWILLTRCDGFALGGMLAVLAAEPTGDALARLRWVFPAVGFGAVLYLVGGMVLFGGRPFLMPPEGPRWPAATLLAINLVFFSVVGLVLLDAGLPWLRPLRARWLGYLGQISYGLYLYHLIVFWLVDRLAARLDLVGPSRVLDLVKIGASVGVAALSWELVEKPILGLKDRLPYGAGPVSRPDSGTLGDRPHIAIS